MAQLNSRPTVDPPLLRIEPFKGINLAVTPTQIDDHQSPDMLNMHIDEQGALNKRTGYKRIFLTLGEGKINGMTTFRKSDGSTDFLFSHAGKLYKTDEEPGITKFATWNEDDLAVTWESEV